MVAVSVLVSPVGVFLKGRNATYPEAMHATVRRYLVRRP